MKLAPDEIRELGFEWPKYPAIANAARFVDCRVDLARLIEGLQFIRDHHQQQVNAAFRFKSQTGADYSDFTDRFDDHARTIREMKQAIAYVEAIVSAARDR